MKFLCFPTLYFSEFNYKIIIKINNIKNYNVYIIIRYFYNYKIDLYYFVRIY